MLARLPADTSRIVTTIDGVDYFVVGVVKTPDGFARKLLCKRRPTIQQANLLYVLSQHVSRVLDMDNICYQLKSSQNAVRVTATHCRKILHYDWAIDGVNNKGLRLSYIGGNLADADSTLLEFNPEVLVNINYRHTLNFRRRVRMEIEE